MKHSKKREMVCLALVIGWCLTVLLTAGIFMAMANTSYAATENVNAIESDLTDELLSCGEEAKVEELPYSDEEVELVALVCMAESEGESELGKRLVIDTVLNRVESDQFPDTIEGVVYQECQFTSMWNGRVDNCVVTDEVRELVREEMREKTNSDVLYFRTDYYHDFGTPVMVEGNHYFSTN